MSKVTRIAYSKNLNQGKYEHLQGIAERLGLLRSEIWQRYGSIAGVGVTHRQVRDQRLAEGRQFDVPARLWKETLRDTMADIVMYREAAKVKVRRAIRQRSRDDAERKRMYTALKYDRWPNDPYLSRMMRRYCLHGHTKVRNQIVLDVQCYTAFSFKGQAWIDVMSRDRGNRIAIPLNTDRLPTGTLRLILRDGRIEVHYTVDAETACSTKPCGKQTLGVDKGYTEAFTDSDGETHGAGLGQVLSAESDYLKVKYQRRNKLKAIAEAKPKKRDKIIRNNLGRQKMDRRRRKHTQRVRDIAFKAAHSIADKAAVVAAEDLTTPMAAKSYKKDQKRRLAGWVKGDLAEALTLVLQRRGSALRILNCAYTSQIDNRYGILLGSRNGDRFYCFDGVVLDADHNAALNILARLDDREIEQYTPYLEVRRILLERTKQKQRLGLLNPDTSCSGASDSAAINGERIT